MKEISCKPVLVSCRLSSYGRSSNALRPLFPAGAFFIFSLLKTNRFLTSQRLIQQGFELLRKIGPTTRINGGGGYQGTQHQCTIGRATNLLRKAQPHP